MRNTKFIQVFWTDLKDFYIKLNLNIEGVIFGITSNDLNDEDKRTFSYL